MSSRSRPSKSRSKKVPWWKLPPTELRNHCIETDSFFSGDGVKLGKDVWDALLPFVEGLENLGVSQTGIRDFVGRVTMSLVTRNPRAKRKP